jgi:hypothetical protein
MDYFLAGARDSEDDDEALYYKPEGRLFGSRWDWIFLLT